MTKRVSEIRSILRKFVNYEKAELLKKELNCIAIGNYIQKYSSKEYISFLSRNESSIKKTHPQETNFPYYMQMFTVTTQHIYADSLEQLLDSGIDIEKGIKTKTYFEYTQ
jgi:hypothetical protein